VLAVRGRLSNRLRAVVQPGAVSPEARYRATMQAWVGITMSVVFLALGVFLLLIPLRANQGCVCVTYAASETVRSSPPMYDVLSEGGTHYLFEQDPHLHGGLPFTVIFGRNGHYQTAIVDNQSYESTSTFVRRGPGAGVTRVVLVGEAALILLGACLFLAFGSWAWSFRRAIDLDRKTPLETITGRYEGSRLPRLALAALGRSSAFSRTASSGFPVLVRTAPGTPRWLTAPLSRAEDVKAFETALRSTSRSVEVKVHPHSGVIASVQGPNGLALALEPAGGVDIFDTSAGLPLGRGRLFSR